MAEGNGNFIIANHTFMAGKLYFKIKIIKIDLV